MVSERLKNIIYKQLNKELGHVEIIPYEDSIYFIDRENKYWYFELTKNEILWWRHGFFTPFFTIFSLESQEFEKILCEWVQQLLDCWVHVTQGGERVDNKKIEEALEYSVTYPRVGRPPFYTLMNDVLNVNISTSIASLGGLTRDMGKILISK